MHTCGCAGYPVGPTQSLASAQARVLYFNAHNGERKTRHFRAKSA